MRNLFLLLISFAGLVRAEAPPNIELTFSLTRNGSHMAEVTEKLEYSGGNYQLTEIWKGKGLYAVMAQARRVSRDTIEQDTLRPREFVDERSGRDTARAWFDWKAKPLTMQYKGNKASEPLPPNAQDRLSFLFALSLVPGKADTVSYTIATAKASRATPTRSREASASRHPPANSTPSKRRAKAKTASAPSSGSPARATTSPCGCSSSRRTARATSRSPSASPHERARSLSRLGDPDRKSVV